MHGSKHRTTDTQIYDARKDGSGYSSIKRQSSLQTHEFNDETANHRKYMRTQSSADNRAVSSSLLSSQQQRQNGEKKSIKDTKKPLRVSGDWSEFKSSTGKTYFYNCKTEVSQWEKPKGWPSAESNRTSTSSIPITDRIKKASAISVTSIVRTRHTGDDSSSDRTLSQLTSEYSNHHHHPNGNHKQSDSSFPSHNRLPSPGDDSSRMSFSSTSSSSKESSSMVSGMNNGNVLHSSSSESTSIPSSDDSSKTLENHNSIPQNGSKLSGQNLACSSNDHKPSVSRSIVPSSTNTELVPAAESEPVTPTISKAEREQEIQKFYRADLIQHLTSWPASQLEKQCLKLFDDYYGYNAKMSTTFSELKALKSNFRILEIKRNILTQKLLRCEKHAKEREEN